MKLKRQLKLQMQRYHEELYLQSLHNCFMQQQQQHHHHPQHHSRIPPPPPSHHGRLYSHPPPPPPSSRDTLIQQQQQPIRNCYHSSDVIRPMPYLKPSVSPPPRTHVTVSATAAHHHHHKMTSDCNQASCRCRHHSVDIN